MLEDWDWNKQVSFKFFDPWKRDQRVYVTWVDARGDTDAIRRAQERLKTDLLARLEITETTIKERTRIE